MDFRTWLLFVPAAIGISLSPGAAAVASMSSGASYGVRRSYLTIFGLEIALMLQLTLVAIGLGALLAASVSRRKGHVLIISNIVFRRLIFLTKPASVSSRLAKRRIAMVTAGYCIPPANSPSSRKVLSE